MGIGPVPAIQNAINTAGMSINDVDRFEVNEAFAAQFLSVQKALELPDEKVNEHSERFYDDMQARFIPKTTPLVTFEVELTIRLISLASLAIHYSALWASRCRRTSTVEPSLLDTRLERVEAGSPRTSPTSSQETLTATLLSAVRASEEDRASLSC